MSKFYKDIRSIQIKTGAFTLLIGVVLIASYLWLTNRINTRSLQEIKVDFADVSGLEIGDKVMYRGMEVGRVRNVSGTADLIRVTARIDARIRLKQGTKFVIGDSSLMGGTALNIIPGSGVGDLILSQVQLGEAPSGVMNIIERATATMDGLNALLGEIRRENGIVDRSENLLADAGSAIRSVDDAASGLSKDVASTLQGIDRLTKQINSVVNQQSGNVDQVLGSAPGTLANINQTLDSLQNLSGKLSNTMDGITGGQGTAGKLFADEQLYHRFIESMQNLDALLKDIKANPKKYVKFSLF